MVHHAGDQYGRQAERDEDVLHVIHDGGKDHQAGVEGGEDGAVDVTVLRKRKERDLYLIKKLKDKEKPIQHVFIQEKESILHIREELL